MGTMAWVLRGSASSMLVLPVLVACSGDYEADQREAAAQTVQQALSVDSVRAAVRRQAPGAEVDEHAGALRIYGAPLARGASHRAAASQFIATQAQAFGAVASDLQPVELVNGTRVINANAQPLGLRLDPATGQYKFYLYRYSQVRSGVPVFGSDVGVLVRNSGDHPVVWSASTAKNLGSFAPTPGMRVPAPNQTKSLAALRGKLGVSGQGIGSSTRITSVSGAELTIFAGTEARVAPHMALQYTVETANPPGAWSLVARADTGDVEHVESLISLATIQGLVGGVVTQGAASMECAEESWRYFLAAEVNVPMNPAAVTGADGWYRLEVNSGGGPQVVSSLVGGSRFDVTNFAGANDVMTKTVTPPGRAIFQHNISNNSDLVRAQSNAFVQASDVRDFLLRYVPNYPSIDTQLDFPIKVNRTDMYCPGNAWYSHSEKSINFCQAGNGRTNTAFASVVHHEYGHHIVRSGGSTQGAYGEGMADVIAMLFAQDPGFAYGWYLGQCSTPLRNADNDCQYLPNGSCSSCGSEEHDCGRLLSGTIWDIRGELMQTEPEGYQDLLNDLVLSSIPMHYDFGINSSIATDLLTLDDDDFYLANGTPHAAEICAGFEAHGMACPVMFCSPTHIGPSCANTPDCGSENAESCCTAEWVPGGSFDRGTTANYPATVSDFCMDKYEVTVGRFREFVAAYDSWTPAVGAGEHLPGAGTGWKSEWDKGLKLPANAAALKQSVASTGPWDTWRDTLGDVTRETLPINLINWHTAFAFCIWDGGRLPTEAEWEYAASTWSEAPYPWGTTPPNGSLALMDFCGNDNSCGYIDQFSDIVPVGSRQPQGDGPFGHSDLVGSMLEYTFDYQIGPAAEYVMPCNDCVAAGPNPYGAEAHRMKSSSYFTDHDMQVTFRTTGLTPSAHGIRCVRMPH